MNGRLANARAITNQTTFMQYLTLCLAEPVLRIAFVRYLIAFHSRPEVTIDRRIRQVSGTSGPRQPLVVNQPKQN